MKYKIYFEKFTEEVFEKYFILLSNEKAMAMITERAVVLTEAKRDYNKLLEMKILAVLRCLNHRIMLMEYQYKNGQKNKRI